MLPLGDAPKQAENESPPSPPPSTLNRIGIPTNCSGLSILNRVGILLVGVFIGGATMMANAMMVTGGTEHALTGAQIGITASYFFIFGGIIGCIWSRWLALLPGIVLQVTALLLVFT
jgi:hypothetical protein